jgi:hypothetical protein
VTHALYKGHLHSLPNSKPSLQSPVMAYFVPSTPSRHRGRSYSLSQPPQMAGSSYPYPNTPYSGYNSLAPSYHDNPGYNPSQTFYVAPSISGRSRGRSRSRSRSRPAHSHSHGHGHSGRRSQSHHRNHGHQRRSHSTASHRHQRPSHHVRFSMSKTERLAQFSLILFSAAHTNLLKQE